MRSYDDITPAQDDAITRLVEHDHTLLIAPKGFGKAVVGQTALQELIGLNEVSRALVLAPLRVCELTWANEHEHWDHLRKPAVAAGMGEVLRRQLIEQRDNDIVLLNFDNLAWFVDTYGRDHGFDALLVDESTKLKAVGGSGFKRLRSILDSFTWRAAMTADAVAEMGTDIYGQALIVDGGKALGRNQEVFRRKYFYPTDFQQRRWRLLPGMEEPLQAALAGILYVAQDPGYEDTLPALVDDQIPLVLPPHARALYDRLEADGGIELDGVWIEAPSAGVVAAKRHQLCAGSVYDANGVAHWVHGEKFDALTVFLTMSLQEQQPLVVAYFYRFELEWLRSSLGDRVAVLADDPQGIQDAWNAGEVSILALHPGSAGHGLNLQYGGHQLLVLTAPHGADPWEQLLGRLRRRGQPADAVYRTTLYIEDSVDEDCLARHLEKRYESDRLNDAFLLGAERDGGIGR